MKTCGTVQVGSSAEQCAGPARARRNTRCTRSRSVPMICEISVQVESPTAASTSTSRCSTVRAATSGCQREAVRNIASALSVATARRVASSTSTRVGRASPERVRSPVNAATQRGFDEIKGSTLPSCA